MPVEKTKTKRQLVEEARTAALESRWDDAITLNDQVIGRYPKDAEAFNRRGRALAERQRFAEAFESYQSALRSDPANMIARRNLQRLDQLRGRAATEPAPDGGGSTIPRTLVFIEEVGKTWHSELVNPAETTTLAEVAPGEQLQLTIEGNRLIALDQSGERLGEIEATTAERVIELISGGNRYEIYALGLTAQGLRVIVREVYRDPSQSTKVSFPGKIKATRAYERERDLLRNRDEADFFGTDDDDETEEDEEPRAEIGDEIEPADPVEDPFVPEGVTVDDDEEQQ